MAYLISDKRHGNEVYVTKAALNCGFFFFPLLETGMTDLLSSPLLTTAMFVIWCVLSAYHWYLFSVLRLELSSEKKKRKGVEAEGSKGLARGAVGIFCFCWKAWCPCWRDWCHS